MEPTLSVVILAAGQGTRMKSTRAKVLHRVGGQPLVHFPVQRARELGAQRIVVVVGHQHAEVRAAIEQGFGAGAVELALQAEQLGTAHAVAQAMPLLAGASGPVLILYADAPLLTTELLVRLRTAWPAGGLALISARFDDPFGYGRILRTPDGGVARVVEEKDCTPAEKTIQEINAGIYCVEAALLREALGQVGRGNAQREFYLTDLAELAAKRGKVVPVEAPAEEVAGINDRAALAEAEATLRRRTTRALMLAGVTVADPDRMVVDVGVRV